MWLLAAIGELTEGFLHRHSTGTTFPTDASSVQGGKKEWLKHIGVCTEVSGSVTLLLRVVKQKKAQPVRRRH